MQPRGPAGDQEGVASRCSRARDRDRKRQTDPIRWIESACMGAVCRVSGVWLLAAAAATTTTTSTATATFLDRLRLRLRKLQLADAAEQTADASEETADTARRL